MPSIAWIQGILAQPLLLPLRDGKPPLDACMAAFLLKF